MSLKIRTPKRWAVERAQITFCWGARWCARLCPAGFWLQKPVKNNYFGIVSNSLLEKIFSKVDLIFFLFLIKIRIRVQVRIKFLLYNHGDNHLSGLRFWFEYKFGFVFGFEFERVRVWIWVRISDQFGFWFRFVFVVGLRIGLRFSYKNRAKLPRMYFLHSLFF